VRRKRKEEGEEGGRREEEEGRKGERQASGGWLHVDLDKSYSSVAVAAMFGVFVVLSMCGAHCRKDWRKGGLSTHPPFSPNPSETQAPTPRFKDVILF